jgi:aspartate/methionine/tyrosine aminotransferase
LICEDFDLRESGFMMAGRFSRRTGWDTTETEWARLLRERRAAPLPGNDPILDLTASNPTHCGFDYDPEGILGALRDPAALRYDPNPRGLPTARQAVASYYADHGAVVDPEQIFLTTSTSEAYSFLFRLFCDPGDEILIAQPSYPLFDFLAALDDVRLVSYPLFYDYGWHLDCEALRQRITPLTRAIVLVHPNNPTGHFIKAGERAVLEEICAEHGLVLIVDEVFLDYSLGEGAPERSFAVGDHPVPTFVLSGLSKIAALPQMKSAWVACFGPSSELAEAMQRLEVIADTFLSMNAPVQSAMPQWLVGRQGVQGQIRARTRANLQALDEVLAGQSLASRLIVEAGWYAVLRIPALVADADTALELLKKQGVAVHSGDFFGFGESGWLVVSLLAPEAEFRRGAAAITSFVQQE